MKSIRRLLLVIAFVPCFNIEAQGIDYDILCGLQQRRTSTMNTVMEWTSNSLVLAPAVPAALWVAASQSHEHAGELKQLATATTVSFATAFVVTEGVKYIVRRPRPYKGHPDDLIPVKTTLGYSFPSGHTALTFSVATSLSLSYPKWYIIAPSMLWASSVAFSRLYLGVHYPSDVLTGIVVGAASGVFGYLLSIRLQEDEVIPQPKMMTLPIVIKF